MSQEVYKKAIETWGSAAQIEMMIEECSELTQAIQKLKRSYYSNDDERIAEANTHVCEELADVNIMLEQMMFVFDSAKISNFKEAKIERLKGRIEKSTNKK